MGRAVPGVPLHIIDEGGRIVKDHTEGDIAIRMVNEQGKTSPFVYDGYISKDGSLSRKSRPFVDASGHVRGEWHLTGDRAYQDKDGYLWFVGRSDDVINSSGYRIGRLALLLVFSFAADRQCRTIRSRINAEASPRSCRVRCGRRTRSRKRRGGESICGTQRGLPRSIRQCTDEGASRTLQA